MIPVFFSNPPRPIPKTLIETIVETCQPDPKPLFCELPDDLKDISRNSKYFVTYTTTISGTASGPSTTTTTLPLEYTVK